MPINFDDEATRKRIIEIAQHCVRYQSPPREEAVYTWLLADRNLFVYRFQLQINNEEPLCVFIFVVDITPAESIILLKYLQRFYEDASREIEAQPITDLINAEKSKIIFSGFGLGAGLAQISACYHKKQAITFESPGMHAVFQKFVNERRNEYISFKAEDITSFLTVPNEINTWGEQVGQIQRIRIKHVEHTSKQHVLMLMLKGALILYSLVHFYRYVSSYRAVGRLTNEVNLLNTIVEGWDEKLQVNQKALLHAQNMDDKFGLLKQNSVTENKQLVELNTKYHVNASQELSRVKETRSLTRDNLGMLGLSFILPLALRVFWDYATSVKQFVGQGQCSLDKIVSALMRNDSTRIDTEGEEGHVFSIKHWPTTLLQSRRTQARNFVIGLSPFCFWNPGIGAVIDEDHFLEAQVKQMDGYELPRLSQPR